MAKKEVKKEAANSKTSSSGDDTKIFAFLVSSYAF